MMKRTMMALLVATLSGSPAFAQKWAAEMFEVTSHDFGTVARNSLTEFAFKLKNIYEEDVHVAGVRSSCGCTSPRIEKPLLKTYEEGAIIAHVNTDRFLGRKGATVTVTFDKPYPAQVQLQVRTYIRDDVVIRPGSVQFGSVDRGTTADRQVQISCPGRSGWRIVEVKNAASHLFGELIPINDGWGQTGYQLQVRLNGDAPVGYFREHLMLVTNDHQRTEIPVLVEGRVLPEITISPASLFMGVVKPGEKVVKPVVVQGKTPFRIKGATAGSDRFALNTSAEQAPKSLHVIPVTFTAGDEPGKVTQTIRIETDQGETITELLASAVVSM